MRPLHLLLPLCFLACPSPAEDSGDTEPEAKPVTISIDSPEDGQVFAWDDSIELSVSGRQGAKDVQFGAITWTVGQLTKKGNDVTIESLSAGEYEVEVDAVVDGEHYRESVDITVEAKPVETGDTGSGEGTHYVGTMDAHVTLTGDFDLEGDCPGDVDVLVSESGVLTGTGQCELDGQFDIDFTLEGTVGGGEVSGELIMTDGTTEYRTPFEGTGGGAKLNANYDKTFSSDGNTLRINGVWSATAQ